MTLQERAAAQPPLPGERRFDEPQAVGGRAALGVARRRRCRRPPRRGAEVRRERGAHVVHRRERGHVEGHRRHHHALGLGRPIAAPSRAHGEAVLAHRNGDAQRLAQFGSGRHGFAQRLILALVPSRRHPIRGQHDAARIDGGGGQIGERFRHRHARCRRGVQHRQRRPFAHRHRLAAVGLVVRQRHRHVGHRHLASAHHLIPRHEAGDAAVANGDQELLACHSRKAQHPFDSFGQVQTAVVERARGAAAGGELPHRVENVAEQRRQRHVHRRRAAKPRIHHQQPPLGGGLANHRVRAALALANSRERRQVLRPDGERVALLGLVAPNLHRRHAGIGGGHGADVEAAANAGVAQQFRQRVGKPAGAHVVDQADGIGGAEGAAAVDHLLAAALHLGVVALHGGEVQLRIALACGHAGRRAATQADEHGRAAQDHQFRAHRHGGRGDVFGGHGAHATGDHHRLVIAP